MKLHSLTVNNINSLYGTHTLDFDRDLQQAPLFLIMGPTGAGKSTLTDSVSLALFGRTPRLTGTRGDEEREPWLVMSRGTGECRVEVVFSRLGSQGREHFRAGWSCRRARNRPEGKPQPPERSLERRQEDGTWKLLTSGSKKGDHEAAFVIALGGMTAEDFQRSVLLAQGEFAAFLRATESERASILERLTNTDEYQRIGARAAAMKSEKERILQDFDRRLEGVFLLDPEQLRALEQTIRDGEGTLTALQTQRNELSRGCVWLQQLHERREQVEQASERLEQARQDRDARAADLERLAEHQRCLPGMPPWQELRRLRGELERDSQHLPGLQERLTERSALVPGLEQALQQALSQLQGSRETLSQRRPALQEARDALTHARHTREELQKADDALRDAHTRHAAAADGVLQRRATLSAAEHALTVASSERERHRQAQGYAERLAGWRTSLEQLQRQMRQLRDLEQALDADTRCVARLEADSASAVESVGAAQAGVSALEAQLQALLRVAQPLLQDAPDLGAAREATQLEIDRQTELRQALAGVQTALARIKERAVSALQLQDELRAGEQARSERLEVLARLSAERPALDAALERAQERVGDLELIERFMNERVNLREGHPCPLCGSIEHPFQAQAHGDEHEELKSRLQDARSGLQQARSAVEAHQQHHTQHETRHRDEQERAQKHQRDASQALGLLEGDWKELSRLLHAAIQETLPPLPPLEQLAGQGERLGEEVRSRQSRLEESFQQLRQLLLQLKELDAGRSRLEKQLTDARKAHQERERTLQKLQGELDRGQVAQRLRLTQRQEALGLLEEDTRSLGERLESEGLMPGPDAAGPGSAAPEAAAEPALAFAARLEVLKTALDRADAEIRAWREAEAGLVKATEAYDAARTQAASAEEGEQRAAESLDRARTDRQEREALDRIAGEHAASLLDGADPDAIEQELEQQVRRAESVLERAQKEEQAGQNGKRDAEQALAALHRRLETLQTERQAAERELELELNRLDLADEASLVRRLILDRVEREALEDLAGDLLRRLDRAEADRAAGESLLQRHLESLPGGLALDADLGALQAEAAEQERALEALRTELARRRSERQQQLDNLARFESLQKQRAEARAELLIWEDLHKLIGVNNGDEFKKFAQILNLRELLRKANSRLKWLAPRYTLLVAQDREGQDRLAFAVSDAHQADERRPLTTLSGGETFLVSLSLALALADYRELDSPIETLLLDEGFGTLDVDTLNTAMDALERLQARGAQVGIISHVEGLKERIEARIVVQKLGNGRSELKVELGSARRV